MNEKPKTVTGEYLKHTEHRSFVYRYTCHDCGKKFREGAPELSFPALCHKCYAGLSDWYSRKGRRYRKKGKSHEP